MFDNFPLWPDRASSTAGNVDALFIFLLIVSGLMTLLIFTAVLYFAARYRQRQGVPAEQIEGSTPLELTWSIIPFFVFMVIFAWGAVVYFEAWMNGGTTGPLSASGEKIFAELGCVTCHRSDTQGRGPNLQGVFGKPVQLEDGRTVTVAENYVRESILDPGAKVVNGFKPVMPTFQGLVSEEQLNALVAYVKSQSQPTGPGTKTSATAAPQNEGKPAGSQVQ